MGEPKPLTENEEPKVRRVVIGLCEPCLAGEGSECHTPGCALYLHNSPGHPIGPEMYDDAADLDALTAECDREKGRAGKLAAENVTLRAASEEVRGWSSTCGYDYGNSRIHKLALEALGAVPETTKVQAVLEAAVAETQAEAECMHLLREAERGHPLRRVVRVNRARQSVDEARERRRNVVRAWRGEPK